MQLVDLQKAMVANSIPRFLVFYGDEQSIIDQYVKQIQLKSSSDIFRLDSVREVYSKVIKKRISGSSRLFAVRDDQEYLKDEKAWDRVQAEIKASSDYVVLLYSKLDKRGKFYKRGGEELVEFPLLGPEILLKYIDKELPDLGHQQAQDLIKMCDSSYGRILSECDKIRRYAKLSKQKPNQAFRDLVNENVIYQPIGDITFKLTDAILTKNRMDSLDYSKQAKLIGEPPIMTLSILYIGFKHILMVQGLGNFTGKYTEATGLTPFQVMQASQKKGKYSIQELVEALKLVHKLEVGIKTGTEDPDTAIDYLIVRLMSRR